MLLYMIRHGETDYNIQGRMQGHVDRPLNEKGMALAKKTGEGMKDIHFDLVYTSPLKRAYDTAKAVMDENQASEEVPIICDDRLKEICWGDWEGKICTGPKMELPREVYKYFYEKPFTFEAPGGETVQAVCDRMEEFYQELMEREELQDKTILISTHGCAVRALLQNVYEEKGKNYWHGKVPENCAVNIVKVEDGKSTLIGDDILYYNREESSNLYGSEYILN